MMYSSSYSNPKPNKSSRLKIFIKYTLLIIFIMSCIVMGGGVAALKMLYEDLPSVAKLENYEPPTITKIYDANNTVLYEFYEERRIPITLDQMPPHLIDGLIAVEDRRFYSHRGIDFQGIARAIWVDIREGGRVQGASTITQQLARNLFLTHERTWIRKIREILLSLQIESRYSKGEILEFYFNQIYFGHGAYGVEAASQLFFGKAVKETTTPEAALLVGIPQRPALYSPYDHPDHALRRRNVVMKAMQQMDFITEAEYQDFSADTLVIQPMNVRKNKAPYFVEYIRKQLEQKFGSDNLYQAGYQVYTTLDINMQTAAQEIVENRLQKLEKQRRYKVQRVENEDEQPTNSRTDYVQGALLAIDPRTGYIKSMIGGRDFYESRWNRAVQATRQPGSSFKPFVYTAALDNGVTPADIILDIPVIFDEGGAVWAPSNYDRQFKGPISVRTGLKLSRNIISVKLLRKMGVYTVIDYARRIGIKSDIQPYLSIALGSSEVTMLEMVNAYCTFANMGVRVEPISIMRIEDRYGNVIEENKTFREEVLSEQTTYLMVDMMQDVVDHGTAYSVRARGFRRPAAGKTGTTNDFTDAWFIGFVPQLVCGVWVGFDTKKSLGSNMSGGKVAVPLWTDFMKAVTDTMEVIDFTRPDGISTAVICTETGLLKTEFCPNTRTEVFLSGTEPIHECHLHNATTMNAGSGTPFDFNSDDEQSVQDFYNQHEF